MTPDEFLDTDQETNQLFYGNQPKTRALTRFLLRALAERET